MFNCCEPTQTNGKLLKSDLISDWLKAEWITPYAEQDRMTVWTSTACIEEHVLVKFDLDFALDGGFRFSGWMPIECPVASENTHYAWDGKITQRTGGFLYRFTRLESADTIEIPVVGAHYSEDCWNILVLACVPRSLLPAWMAFEHECERISSALPPNDRVIIVGGNQNAFVPTVNWEDVVLPAALKSDLFNDVQSFFTKGISVYKRLNLKPFRKLLLAGVPGTGKTMLCNALAKWSLEQDHRVIYVSSAQRRQGDEHGAHFEKIQYALEVAASSQSPTLIILEELDAYLHPEEKALVLNVLDGSEAPLNEHGTLLISTTNYPEAIDERILKRPGRLDRIFIIPETRSQVDAGQMLRKYLGAMWQDNHAAVVPQLVGYPGAFIREVAIYALTQVAYDDLSEVSVELLERSFTGLKEQIASRDEFLKARANGHVDPEVENVN